MDDGVYAVPARIRARIRSDAVNNALLLQTAGLERMPLAGSGMGVGWLGEVEEGKAMRARCLLFIVFGTCSLVLLCKQTSNYESVAGN